MENIHDATKDVILSLNDVTPENVNTFIDSNERLSTVVDLAGATPQTGSLLSVLKLN